MLRKSFVALLMLALALSACGLIESAQAFTKTGTDFMTALKDGKYEAAYALCHPSLQQEAGTAADLQALIESNSIRPEDWSFSSMNANTDADQVTTATLEGSVTYQDGRSGAVTLELVQDGDVWKIVSFNFTW